MIYLIKKIINKRRLETIRAKIGKIGKNVQFDLSLNIISEKNLFIGDNVYIGPKGFINAVGEVDIKSGTIIGPNLLILTANHNFRNSNYLPYDETYIYKKVIIEENVWIASNVIVTPGTIIGEGSVIGAGTVVSGKIPPLSVVVGNPCKIISTRDEEHYYRLKKDNKIYLEAKTNREI